jgi:manganese/iron transport system permease protein/iron/zinc/copper transport system permease protein
MQFLSFALLGLSLVASLQAVGCVLSVGLLVAPAATVSLLTDRTSLLFWGGALVGTGGAIAGVLLSAALDLSTGPTIVMVLGGLFLLAWLFSPKYGLLAAPRS